MKTFITCILFLLLLPLSAAAKDKPLELWVNSPTDVKYYKNMIKLYREKRDKDFEIIVRHYGFVEMPDKLSVAIKTGINTPDIVQIDELFFSIFLSGEIPFLDLTDRVGKAGFEQNLLQQRLALFSYQDKIYGLPQSVAAVVLYYRNDLFSLNNIDPNEIGTWDKFVKAGQKLNRHALLALDWSYFEILLRQRGFDLFDNKGNPIFDSPEAIETLEFLVELADKKVGLNPDRGSIFSPVFFSGDVANSEVLSVMGAGWYGLDMLRNFSPPEIKGKWRAMPLPIWTDKKSRSQRATSVFAGQGLLIYKKSEKADKAWDFIKFVMGNKEAAVERYLQGNCFPTLIPAWTDSRLNQPDPFFGGQSLGRLIKKLAHQIPTPVQVPARILFTNLFREKYWHLVISGAMPPKQVLKEIKLEILRARKSK